MDLDSIEEICLPNYTAVSILERLGIDPNQEQIDIIESLVLMASYPKKVNSKMIAQCVGSDKLASLFLYLRNKDLRE